MIALTLAGFPLPLTDSRPGSETDSAAKGEWTAVGFVDLAPREEWGGGTPERMKKKIFFQF